MKWVFLLQPLAKTQQRAENNIGVLMAAAARDDKKQKQQYSNFSIDMSAGTDAHELGWRSTHDAWLAICIYSASPKHSKLQPAQNILTVIHEYIWEVVYCSHFSHHPTYVIYCYISTSCYQTQQLCLCRRNGCGTTAFTVASSSGI